MLAAAHLHGCLELVLPMLPLLALVASLLGGRYPGSEALARLAERIAPRGLSRRRSAVPRRPRPTRPDGHHVAGGLLIAFGLATRPPPVCA
jgi:hypothetical protein